MLQAHSREARLSGPEKRHDQTQTLFVPYLQLRRVVVCSLRRELKFHDESGTGATHRGCGESRLEETLDHDASAGRIAGGRSGRRVSEGDRLRGLDQRGPWDAGPVRASDGAAGG